MIIGNEPAFAKSAFYHPDGGVDSPQFGLTIRQYYAGLAMQAIVMNPTWNGNTELTAIDALQITDALIAELNKKQL